MKHTHRIGTVTFGASLIAFGAAFLLHFFIPTVSVMTVISFWPVIFILLGLEVLVSTFHRQDDQITVYDKTGIILTALLVIFAMGMGVVSLMVDYAMRYTI